MLDVMFLNNNTTNKKKLTDSKKYPSLIALYEISFILLRLIQSYYCFANFDG